MGCPTFTVRGCNAAQGMIDGENGYLCENDLDSLHAQMQAVLLDPLRAAAIGKRAQQTLAPSWESIVDQVYAEYVKLLYTYTPERARELGL